MKVYTIADLKKRYNINSRQGVAQFVQTHLSSLNAEGEHAKKVAGKWVFDEVAIEILDNLRSASGVTIVEEDSERVAALKAENEQLKEMLIAIQSKLIETQDNERATYQQLVSTQEQLSTTQKQLTSMQNQLMTIKIDKSEIESKHQEQLATIRVDIKEKEKKIEELEKAELRAKKLEQELDNIRQRSLLERLLNKDL